MKIDVVAERIFLTFYLSEADGLNVLDDPNV